MSIEQFAWYMMVIDLCLLPVAWIMVRAGNRRAIREENVYLEKLAREHPEQWKRNE